MEERRNAYNILIWTPEHKGPLVVRPRHTLEDNIRVDLRDIGWGGAYWTGFICLKIGTSGRLL